MTDINEPAVGQVFPVAIKNILVPVDMRHKNATERAIAAAVWISSQTEAPISVLTVAKPLGITFSDMPEDHKPEFDAFVAEMAKRHDHEITAVFRSHESIRHVIHQVIKDNAMDFVVMATHHPRLVDHLFGSDASQTVLHEDCSVLILRGD